MAGGSKKGSPFEREVCKTLSLWWTEGKRDDVFYRTGGSGGRATKRGRIGKTTVNHDGDVQASDPVGIPLMRLMAIEIKRGYNSTTLQDIVDAPHPRIGTKPPVPTWVQWFQQAQESARHARATGWAVIARRDKRRTVICLSEAVWLALFYGQPILRQAFKWRIHLNYPKNATGTDNVVLVRLEDFLILVSPQHVRNCERNHSEFR